jgi:dTDP-4-amino-4,6-dideoxygalactose transaminase
MNNINIELFKIDKNSKNVFHLFAFKIKKEYLAKKLRSFLQNKKIPATFHYVPLHTSPFGKKFRKSNNMEVTDKEWKKLIRLPIYPDLREKDIKIILDSLSLFFKQKI